ncbi:2-polyprenyl-6-methoxyphenol hydroxylase-like FAD-dependent oxidoreductase [Nonomuraea thailandensis]|uniref:2-polyprenyl-6-methoxyphenol hydroxylase-like FAD-dependent oxidoreductase n=1 Tax=Nonomuraea thailandensis TaxID=1188745 RepID=A0A9X2H0J6_9ACTN|nr:FAD-dependent monooxygenase [Nonomuraea thailandensis]MCP2363718.1 2-polyprenyl-6-methoxyphenol hydroxylase-like FAD-dependent oxidoreductase [Nonomuraea thailandensis]
MDLVRQVPDSVPVLIAGGGPVGLATAVELAHHGVRCLVVEPRETVSWLRPRAKTTSARSMELLRRWGLAQTLRSRAPLAVSWSNEAVFVTGLLGREITRISGCFGLDLVGSDLAAEPGQQVPQPLVEEVLREAVGDALLTGWQVAGLREDADGVTVRITSGDQEREVRAQYVVGCDGPRSVTRAAIGSKYEGRQDARPNFNIVFRAPGLAERMPHGPAVHYWVLNPAQPGMLGRLDLKDTWWCIAQGVRAEDADPVQLVRNLAGADIEVEVLATDPWTARMLLADRYAGDRVFLAGDAAHQNPPYGGHGFNTGIGDAVNIGWKLAAVLLGWAPPSLLATYESERRPIAADTIEAAASNMATLAPELADPALMGDEAEFEKVRPAVAEAVLRTKDSEFHSLDLVLGYTYAGSSIVASGAGERLPHRWLAPGESLYDRLGPAFSLVGDQRSPASAVLVAEAAELGVPLRVVDLPGEPLSLVRPDQHVAWRGGDPAGALRTALAHDR